MKKEINNAVSVLQDGGIILCPTDTIWGIGCDATNEKAVKKICIIKQRQAMKGFIILVSDEKMLLRFAKEVPALAFDLIESNDAPLTIIYDSGRGLAKNVLADDGSIAVRLVKDEFCQRLIHKFGKPIVSTSANIGGESPPKNFSDISDEIKEKVDYVINYRQNERKENQPSGIIKLKANGEFQIIR